MEGRTKSWIAATQVQDSNEAIVGKRAVVNPHTRATFKLEVLPSIVEWKTSPCE